MLIPGMRVQVPPRAPSLNSLNLLPLVGCSSYFVLWDFLPVFYIAQKQPEEQQRNSSGRFLLCNNFKRYHAKIYYYKKCCFFLIFQYFLFLFLLTSPPRHNNIRLVLPDQKALINTFLFRYITDVSKTLLDG